MSPESSGESVTKKRLPRWVGPVIFILAAAVVALLGMLAVSIMERRWEAQRPALVLKPIDRWEPDNAVWGENYPREYEAWLETRITDTRTRYGGAYPRDYLDEDPNLVILWTGYGFSKDYKQARGHWYTVRDVTSTERVGPKTPATCWTCKSTDVPRMMDKLGVKAFYETPFMDLKDEITHPLGCQDCHDPKTMNLRITRPALREAFEAMGRDVDEADHQDMRSLVCAQCHVEYYFKGGTYLTFPWEKGTRIEQIIEYYDCYDFSDFTHAISNTPIVKAQHPDYELYSTGIHSYRDVSCADCHMPYRTEGGVKFTDHHVQSPLLNISNSCAVCHRWSEEEIRTRVYGIQDKVENATLQTEDALVKAHFDMAAAMQAGVGDEELKEARRLLRHAQFRWDFISSNNGMGFHSAQESMRILGDATDGAQQARLLVARLLAKRGVTDPPTYPDVSTREAAEKVMRAFEAGEPINLLPSE
jgi:nitrite reductase (cytochrome c-552)